MTGNLKRRQSYIIINRVRYLLFLLSTHLVIIIIPNSKYKSRSPNTYLGAQRCNRKLQRQRRKASWSWCTLCPYKYKNQIMLHLFEREDSSSSLILKRESKKMGADENGSDQHLVILVSSEWRSYWQTSNNLPPFLPTGSQLQMTILNLHISVINSFEKSEVHANNQFGKTLQEDHDFSTCSKFTQGSIMLRDRTWSPSINAKS